MKELNLNTEGLGETQLGMVGRHYPMGVHSHSLHRQLRVSQGTNHIATPKCPPDRNYERCTAHALKRLHLERNLLKTISKS
jgi:hypothetical protein